MWDSSSSGGGVVVDESGVERVNKLYICIV